MRLGIYKNEVTNRLDGLLDRIEVLVRPSH
jgi:hypothetical protein